MITDLIMTWAQWSYRIVIFLIIIIIQEMNGAYPVLAFVFPRVICHVIHQALQGSTAGKFVGAWGHLRERQHLQSTICIIEIHAHTRTAEITL